MRAVIQDAPFAVFLAMVGLPLLMAAVAVIAGVSARRKAAVVKDTKAVPIGMAENGYRQFEGRVEAIGGELVTAPLTGSPCVWYSAKVEEWKRSTAGNSKKSEWCAVKSITSSAPLLVRDDSGACLVRLFGADVTPRDKSRWTGDSLEPADRNPPRLGLSESTDGMVQVAGGPHSRFRYTETRIYDGDPLMVVGRFDSHRFDSPEELDEAATTSHRELGRTARDDWDAADIERHDTLTRLGAAITRAEIQQGGHGEPLVVTASSAAVHVAMNEMGAQAAFTIALVPLGIAALVLLARWG